MPAPSQESPQQGPAQIPKGDYLMAMNRDLRAVNASVLVITQKIKYLIRNEKILGRNLIVINKRVRDIQQQMGNTEAAGINDQVRAAISDLSGQVSAISQRLVEIEAKREDVSKRSAKEDELREIKYVVDTINPLNFVTIDQAKQMINEKDKK